jgi:serine/threonine protein kinase
MFVDCRSVVRCDPMREHARQRLSNRSVRKVQYRAKVRGMLSQITYKQPMTTNTDLTWMAAGQGDAFRACRNSDEQIAFLKTIKAKKDPERRARFFREANAYDTFRIDGVPHLIESNAHLHKDMAFEPYIATSFVIGPTVRKWRETEKGASLDTAVLATQRLLGILGACHDGGCVHRDVKPDNLILEAGDPSRLCLLDFGLNYHDLPDIDFQTENWQEVGNRFLRLPELSAGSLLKQDPRSDLSFAAGILFYLITSESPDVLQDAEGRLPHQRSGALAKLQAVAGRRFPRLASIFDSTFAPVMADRFSNAAAMRDSLDRMMTERGSSQSADDDLAAILEVIDTAAQRRRMETTRRLRQALENVQTVFSEVQKSLGGALMMGQTGFGVDGEVGRNTLLWTRPGSNTQVLSTSYEVRETGDEIVIRLSGQTVFRTSLSAPNYGDDFQTEVRSWLLARIRATVSDPDALPPEADNFAEVRPFSKLDDALKEAARSGRKILAFVYDPSQPERGRLQQSLGYFLQNRRTRDLMNAAFVTALVPLSQVVACSEVLSDVSMEQSRWVVFDSMLNPLEQAVIYANPQEAERLMKDLAKRFGSM